MRLQLAINSNTSMLLGIFLALTFLTVSVNSDDDGFGYEKMQNFGKGRRVIPNYKHFLRSPYAYPEPMPVHKPTSIEKMDTPFEKLYQGTKRKTNVRVYNKKFNFNPKPQGHLIRSSGDLTCKITYLAVETEGGIPIILNGGVGYFFFNVVVKARPYDRLKGRVRAWCNNDTIIFS